MLYDALLTLDLPRKVGPPLPTGFWDGAGRLLFTGSWARRAATCTVSSAAVLAGCHAALRTAGPEPAFEILDDVGELFDLSAIPEKWGDAPPPWAEILPPRWTTEPCAFRLRVTWNEGGFATVVLLRHAPRHDLEQAALSGSVRVLWAPEALGPRLEARLDGREVGAHLAWRLRLHGDRVLEGVAEGLTDRLEGAASHRSRLVVLADTEAGSGFGELLAGFPEPAVQALGPIRDTLHGWWPAVASDGVEGRWRKGRFVPSAEVDHAL